MLKMFSKFLAGQSFRFAIATFVPTNPPACDIFSFVNPYLFHIIHYIVIMGVQIKQKRELRIAQISVIMETRMKLSKAGEL